METILSNIPAKAYAILLLVTGFMLRHWVRSRRMHRINKEGVTEFATYGHKVVLTQFEKFIMLIGRLLTLAGILVWGADWIIHKD